MLCAVAVDDGRLAPGRPELGLVRPVGLDDVGYDGEQRVGVGGLCGEQGLGRLAQTGLVGQQEGAVPGLRGGDHLRLVVHQLLAARGPQRGRLGERHARRRAGRGLLERTEQRAEQLPGGERARLHVARRGVGEVGGEERVRELARDHRLGHHAALGGAVGGRLRGRFLGLGLDTTGLEHLPLQGLGGVGDDGVLTEQLEEGRVAGGRLGQDRRDAVEALELSVALGLGALLVGLDAGALVADEQGDHLEHGAVGDAHRAALDPRLDLAHLAGEDRDDAFVVARTGTLLVPLRRTTTTRLTSALTSHSLLLRSIRRTHAHRTTSARTHGRCDRASYGTGLDVAVPRRGPRI